MIFFSGRREVWKVRRLVFLGDRKHGTQTHRQTKRQIKRAWSGECTQGVRRKAGRELPDIQRGYQAIGEHWNFPIFYTSTVVRALHFIRTKKNEEWFFTNSNLSMSLADVCDSTWILNIILSNGTAARPRRPKCIPTFWLNCEGYD